MPDILTQIRARGCVLLLDFDGVLVPIHPQFDKPRLSLRGRVILARVAKQFPVAVISGRGLADVRARVGVPGISYAGSHGLQTRLAHGKSLRTRVTSQQLKFFRQACCALTAISKQFPHTRPEDKGMSFTIHYRHLARKDIPEFKKAAHKTIALYLKDKHIRLLDDQYSFDISPDVHYTKGECALDLFETLRSGPNTLPVYIGDALTDEDAFRMFPHGITIRVGHTSNTSAKYYFRNQREVTTLLSMLGQGQSK